MRHGCARVAWRTARRAPPVPTEGRSAFDAPTRPDRQLARCAESVGHRSRSLGAGVGRHGGVWPSLSAAADPARCGRADGNGAGGGGGQCGCVSPRPWSRSVAGRAAASIHQRRQAATAGDPHAGQHLIALAVHPRCALGAQACGARSDISGDRGSQRMRPNKATVAVVNTLARIAWAVLRRGLTCRAIARRARPVALKQPLAWVRRLMDCFAGGLNSETQHPYGA